MSWVLLLGLAGVVFLNRYIFLEPHLNIQLPIFLQKMLRHSAPHLMLVIAAPIIFLEQGQLRESVFDPYILAVVVCVLQGCWQQKLLLNFVLVLTCFYLFQIILQ
ncbi:AzlD domain-containing protein [Acinetobacter thermotolerans]|uniref:AzlD domain-containing protein n=1 Tax=Acinetobacter thermotolerans TaxID=3151487 RepID=UPI00325B5699